MCNESSDKLENEMPKEHLFTEHDQKEWDMFLQLVVKRESTYEGLGK